MPKRSLDAAFMVEGSSSASNSRQPNSLFVSFSKRRRGLFQKAAELCKICNAEVAVLIVSPTGNPFAFGHSSVDSVLQRYYLRQTMPNMTNHPPMITTGRAGAITDKHRDQVRQVGFLKARVKQTQNREGSALKKLKAWIEKAWESCKTVEELESRKHMYLALLQNVRNRLLQRSSSSSSFYGEGSSTAVVGPAHFTDEWLISGTGFDGKVGQTTSVVGPVAEYVFDDKYFVASNGFDGNSTGIQSVGMAAESLFQHPGGDDSSDADDVRHCPQSDMSFLLQKFDHNSQQGKVLVGQTSDYGTMVEWLDDNVLNQCFVNGGFDDHVTNSYFFPHHDDGGGGESTAAANIFGVVHPHNDLLCNSIENHGYADCAGSSYSEMLGVSDDEVFNYLGQAPRFNDLNDLENRVLDRKFGSFPEDAWFSAGAEEEQIITF